MQAEADTKNQAGPEASSTTPTPLHHLNQKDCSFCLTAGIKIPTVKQMDMLSWDWEPKEIKNKVDLTHPVKTKVEIMRAYNKAYREKHSGYVECGCGSVYKQISRYTHPKCAKHISWLKTNTNHE